MEYIIDGKKYGLSYKELREEYYKVCELKPLDFKANAHCILHLACIIGYLKEFGKECLSDAGIIHRLVHLIDGTNEVTYSIEDTMELFKIVCKLD